MEQKTITFTHASGVKSFSFPISDIENIRNTLDKCLKGELHAMTHKNDDSSISVYPSVYLQNCYIEIKDKLKPTGIKYRNI